MQQHDKFGGGVTVKKLLLAGLATSALIAPAMAADMPIPAAPVITWTGFYLGVNGGWGMGIDNSVHSVGVPGGFCTDTGAIGCTGTPPFVPPNGIPANTYSETSAQAATFSTPSNRNGGFIG